MVQLPSDPDLFELGGFLNFSSNFFPPPMKVARRPLYGFVVPGCILILLILGKIGMQQAGPVSPPTSSKPKVAEQIELTTNDQSSDSNRNAESPQGVAAENNVAMLEATVLPLISQATTPRAHYSAILEAETEGSIPFPSFEALTGVVSMSHQHPDGTLVKTFDFPDFPGTTGYLEKSPQGIITGHIVTKGQREAIQFSSPDAISDVKTEKLPIDHLMCARIDPKQILGGLAMAIEEAPESEQQPAEAASSSIPLLESNPDATNVIYLDFDGETVSGSSWNQYNDGKPIVAEPFGNTSLIPAIWEIVVQDYNIFDVNVTTDRSVFDNTPTSQRCMAIFTPSKSWYGNSGGVAYTSSFGSSSNYMCWVFNTDRDGASQAATHEVGHQMGLNHDGDNNSAYYSGHTHSSGTSWAPIMGLGYNRNMVQFSKGEYKNANEKQDDLAVIARDLSYRADDFSSTVANSVTHETSETGTTDIIGMIGRSNDVDIFRFPTSKTGTFRFQVERTSSYSNLDLSLTLADQNGQYVAGSAPTNSFNASLTASNLPPGEYFLYVTNSGLGTADTGYTTYGSTGEYHLTGTHPTAGEATTPTGLTATDGTSTEHVKVTWNASANAVGYELYRAAYNSTLSASKIADLTGTEYLDTSASANRTYYFFVRSYNFLGESDLSGSESGFRVSPAEAPDSLSASDGQSSLYTNINWSSGAYAAGYYVYRNTIQSTSGATLLGYIDGDTTYRDDSAFANFTYYYFVQAVNDASTADYSPIDSGFRKAGLSTPTGVTASQGTIEGTVALQWNSVSGAGHYSIYRGTSANIHSALEIAETMTNSYFDDSAAFNTAYYYFIVAEGSSGDSSPSNGVIGMAGSRTPGDDAYEANDRIGAAYSLSEVEGWWLSNFRGQGILADPDWFSIPAPAEAGRVDILLEVTGGSSEIDLTIHDQSGAEITTVSTSGGILPYQFHYPTAGETYFLHLSSQDGSKLRYNLLWRFIGENEEGGRIDLTIGDTLTRQFGTFLQDPYGRRQKLREKVKRPKKIRAFSISRNEGTEKSNVRSYGTGGNRFFKVRYFNTHAGAKSNVTAAMKSSRSGNALSPFQSALLEVKIKPKRRALTRKRKFIPQMSSHIPGVSNSSDTATIFIKAKGKRKRRR
ncbi:MAG: hypothetical protein CMO55_15890 [Verrucomicrobiales bacterium]|nr:hypothetical protein [Verrucomicrobiales bacterium]